MAGLPLDSWILIVTSVGIGLAIEFVFLRAHRGRDDGSSPTGRDRT